MRSSNVNQHEIMNPRRGNANRRQEQ